MRQDIERLRGIAARTRKYASFFEWREKEGKELGVVEEVVSGLNALGLGLRDLRVQRPDPPDCVCEDQNGNSVAIEVAEIVCEDAVRLNAQGHNVYRAWRPGDLSAAIKARLSEKDAKTFHGGPYPMIAVCLFTDEPALAVDFAKRELTSATFRPYNQIGAAYLLFSYDPGSKTYPLLPLRLSGRGDR
jgi:hypothetical protein